MKRLFTLALLLLTAFGLLPSLSARAATEDPPPKINSEYAIIFNADADGEILYGKQENTPVYCGFLPRVMTCLLIMESGRDLNETVTITKEILTNTPTLSTANLKAGDEVSLRDLIVCITVANSQEAAVAAAMTLGGTLPKFVEKMNQRAKELGANDTVFTNVTGSYTSNTKQISTLADCAKILSEALKYPEIETPSAERVISITVSGKTRKLYTRNMLIETLNENYNAAAKGLFIYSESASNSSIATCRKDADRKIISMAITTKGLGSLYKDASVLLSYSQNRYITKTLLAEGSTICEIKVNFGKESDFVLLTPTQSISALVPKIYGQDNVDLVFDIPESMTAPVEKGKVVGTVTVSCDGKTYGTVELKTYSSVSMDYFELYSSRMMGFFANPWLWGILGGLFFLVVGYIFLTLIVNRPRKKRRPDTASTGGRIRMTGSPDDDDN